MRKKPLTKVFFDLVVLVAAMSLGVAYAADHPNIVDDFTEEAMQYIEQHQKDPFFVYLPYNTPHSPMQVPDRWWNKFKDLELPPDHPKLEYKDLQHARAAFAMCENIDWNVGRLLANLCPSRCADTAQDCFVYRGGRSG